MRVVLFRDASAYNFGRRRSGWKDKRKKARAMLVAFGALVVMSAFAVFPPDSSWGSVYAIVGAVVVVAATWAWRSLTSRPASAIRRSTRQIPRGTSAWCGGPRSTAS